MTMAHHRLPRCLRPQTMLALLALPALRPAMGALRDELARQGRLEPLQQLQVWRNAAMSFEVYDMDICPGHAAMG